MVQQDKGNDPNLHSGSVMPEINFITFLLSLNSSALVHLGQHPDPHRRGKTVIDKRPL
jgi:hypothetical protein